MKRSQRTTSSSEPKQASLSPQQIISDKKDGVDSLVASWNQTQTTEKVGIYEEEIEAKRDLAKYDQETLAKNDLIALTAQESMKKPHDQGDEEAAASSSPQSIPGAYFIPGVDYHESSDEEVHDEAGSDLQSSQRPYTPDLDSPVQGELLDPDLAERERVLQNELELFRDTSPVVATEKKRGPEWRLRFCRLPLVIVLTVFIITAIAVPVTLRVTASQDDPTEMIAPPQPVQWKQIGQDIGGKAPHERFGQYVAMSADGSFVAGASAYANKRAGLVRVFRWESGDWRQVGQTLKGNEGSQFGGEIALAGNGRRLAVVAKKGVSVFRLLQNDTWTRIGQTLIGNLTDGSFPSDASISASGDVLAVGVPPFWTNNCSTVGYGNVRAYLWDSNEENWVPIGQDLVGDEKGDWFGTKVSLSQYGNVLAVGTDRSGCGQQGVWNGYVQVMSLKGSRWAPLGQRLYGKDSDDQFGSSLDLSADGETLAVGSFKSDPSLGRKDAGSVQVYRLNGQNPVWTQLGTEIDGDNAGDHFALSVSLSDNGTTVLSGAMRHDANGRQDSGRVRAFRVSSQGEWVPFGQGVNGNSRQDLFGESVSLSADGSIFVAGARENDDRGEAAGHIRVFEAITE